MRIATDYAGMAIARAGSEREISLGSGRFDYRRDSAKPGIPGFLDITGLSAAGVYLLLLEGEVVHVGKARDNLFAKAASLRSRPKSLGLPAHDQVLIREVHPDSLDRVYDSLMETYFPVRPVAIPIERRI